MNDINTYGDLKRAVQLWLNRKDSTTINNIPMFINMALKQFARMMKLPYYEVLVKITATEGVNYVELPNDFLSAKHLMVNGIPYNRLSVNTFQRIKEGNTQVTNLEEDNQFGFLQGATTASEFFFTRIGGQLHFIPELKGGDLVEMIYQRDIPEPKSDTEEVYYLLVASDVLLYLSLKHASTFLRDNEQEQFWMAKAAEAAQSLQAQLEEAEWSGGPLVVPQFSS